MTAEQKRMQIFEAYRESQLWWLGREIICPPVTGMTWHRIVSLQWYSEVQFAAVLEGGNEVYLDGLYGHGPIYIK